MAKNQSDSEEIVKNLFDHLGIKDSFEIDETGESVNVVINSDDPGLIIGHHGDTLDSIQLILSLMVTKKLGEFKRVNVEVGDYKKNRSDYLKTLATDSKERVLLERKEIFLPNLKPWERREVHMHLADDPEVISESVGEGKERTLVIKPK